MKIQGFDNPTVKHMKPPIVLDVALNLMPGRHHIAIAPNSHLASGVESGDWLILDQISNWSDGLLVLVELDGQVVLTNDEQVVRSEGAISYGVVVASVHFCRDKKEPVPLAERTLHQQIIDTKPHACFFMRARGGGMAPVIKSGDLAIVERHLALEHEDISLFSIDGGPLKCRWFDQDNSCLFAAGKTETVDLTASRVTCEGVIGKIIKLHRVSGS